MRLILQFALVLFLFACGGNQIADYTYKSQEVSADLETDQIDTLIEDYRQQMEAIMNKEIGYSDSTLTKFTPESPLSNFVADVVYEKAFEFAAKESAISMSKQNSFCLLNFGGLRAPINNGNVTIGNLYELMPFDNSIYISQLKSAEIDSIKKYLYISEGQPVSNCQFNLSVNNKTASFGGASYDGESDVFVVTSNYLFAGGDKMNFFKKSVNKWDTGILIRDALIEAVSEQDTIPFYPVEGRILIEE